MKTKPKLLSIHKHWSGDGVTLQCEDGPRFCHDHTPASALIAYKDTLDVEDWLTPPLILPSGRDREELTWVREELTQAQSAHKNVLNNMEEQIKAKHKALKESKALEGFNAQLRSELVLTNEQLRRSNQDYSGKCLEYSKATSAMATTIAELRRDLEGASKALNQSNAQLASIKAIVCK